MTDQSGQKRTFLDALADATRCPACGSELTSATCGQCLAPLNGPTGIRLWEVSQQIVKLGTTREQLLQQVRLEAARARAARDQQAERAAAAAAAQTAAAQVSAAQAGSAQGSAAQPAAAPGPARTSEPVSGAGAFPPPPTAPRPVLQPMPAREPSALRVWLGQLSIEQILLGMGAFLVGVMAIGLATLNWDLVPLWLRALGLVGATVAIGVSAHRVRPELVATRETLAAATAVMIGANGWMLRRLGAFGLDAVDPFAYAALGFAALAAALWWWARRSGLGLASIGVSVLVPQVPLLAAGAVLRHSDLASAHRPWVLLAAVALAAAAVVGVNDARHARGIDREDQAWIQAGDRLVLCLWTIGLMLFTAVLGLIWHPTAWAMGAAVVLLALAGNRVLAHRRWAAVAVVPVLLALRTVVDLLPPTGVWDHSAWHSLQALSQVDFVAHAWATATACLAAVLVVVVVWLRERVATPVVAAGVVGTLVLWQAPLMVTVVGLSLAAVWLAWAGPLRSTDVREAQPGETGPAAAEGQHRQGLYQLATGGLVASAMTLGAVAQWSTVAAWGCAAVVSLGLGYRARGAEAVVVRAIAYAAASALGLVTVAMAPPSPAPGVDRYLWAAGAACLLLAAVGLLAPRRPGADLLGPAGLALIVLAPVPVRLASDLLTSAASPRPWVLVGAGIAAALAAIGERSRWRPLQLTGSTAVVPMGALALAASIGGEPLRSRWVSVLVAVALGALAAAWSRGRTGPRWDWALTGAALTLAVTVVQVASQPHPWVAATILAAGVSGLAVVGMIPASWLSWVLGVWALTSRLRESDVGVIEAYTVPAGLALLGLAWVHGRQIARRGEGPVPGARMLTALGLSASLVPGARSPHWVRLRRIVPGVALLVLPTLWAALRGTPVRPALVLVACTLVVLSAVALYRRRPDPARLAALLAGGVAVLVGGARSGVMALDGVDAALVQRLPDLGVSTLVWTAPAAALAWLAGTLATRWVPQGLGRGEWVWAGGVLAVSGPALLVALRSDETMTGPATAASSSTGALIAAVVGVAVLVFSRDRLVSAVALASAVLAGLLGLILGWGPAPEVWTLPLGLAAAWRAIVAWRAGQLWVSQAGTWIALASAVPTLVLCAWPGAVRPALVLAAMALLLVAAFVMRSGSPLLAGVLAEFAALGGLSAGGLRGYLLALGETDQALVHRIGDLGVSTLVWTVPAGLIGVAAGRLLAGSVAEAGPAEAGSAPEERSVAEGGPAAPGTWPLQVWMTQRWAHVGALVAITVPAILVADDGFGSRHLSGAVIVLSVVVAALVLTRDAVVTGVALVGAVLAARVGLLSGWGPALEVWTLPIGLALGWRAYRAVADDQIEWARGAFAMACLSVVPTVVAGTGGSPVRPIAVLVAVAAGLAFAWSSLPASRGRATAGAAMALAGGIAGSLMVLTRVLRMSWGQLDVLADPALGSGLVGQPLTLQTLAWTLPAAGLAAVGGWLRDRAAARENEPVTTPVLVAGHWVQGLAVITLTWPLLLIGAHGSPLAAALAVAVSLLVLALVMDQVVSAVALLGAAIGVIEGMTWGWGPAFEVWTLPLVAVLAWRAWQAVRHRDWVTSLVALTAGSAALLASVLASLAGSPVRPALLLLAALLLAGLAVAPVGAELVRQTVRSEAGLGLATALAAPVAFIGVGRGLAAAHGWSDGWLGTGFAHPALMGLVWSGPAALVVAVAAWRAVGPRPGVVRDWLLASSLVVAVLPLFGGPLRGWWLAVALAYAAGCVALGLARRLAWGVAGGAVAGCAVVVGLGQGWGPALELWTLPLATVAGYQAWRWLRREADASSAVVFWAPLALGLGPSLWQAITAGPPLRAWGVAVACGALMLLGARLKLRAPLVAGALGLFGLGSMVVIPFLVSHWAQWLVATPVILGVIGVLLLVLGATYERRIATLRAVRTRWSQLR